ncbi:ribosomal protein L7/L12 [Streptomyces sp. AV19]|uniref:ribosomal protein L7/L12 n=1 Tax=Streptomyces sp. AV19 TaxID=2793068 RepID=UPI0018FF105C|nr:ribosomal protein L7/L12 [Streptomyces sp. AV19]MBH1937850.1 ribosomal protein L7/L12 [Streptomyces sp. AV19]MDG4537128.1 ribosomal protein L7/L12 [Streptomyces sp. AV19]
MDTAVLLLVFPLLGLLAWSIESRIDRVSRKVTRLERKVDLILGQLGIREEDHELARIAELAGKGETIKAIKAYRELTGDGLKEAKVAVERLPRA